MKRTMITTAAGVALSVASSVMADIPSGYQRVEYVMPNGNCQVKTGLTPACTDIIEMTWRQNSKGAYQVLWCARGATTGDATLTAFTTDNDTVRFDRNTTSSYSTGKITTNVKYTAVANCNTLAAIVKNADTSKVVASATMSNGTFTPGSQICLFASHVGDNVDSGLGFYATHTVYAFKISDSSGAAKCNLVPVKRLEDGVVGLYDTVRSTFCTNGLSTGTLQAGPEVRYVVPSEYQEIEYVTATDNCQVKTGLTPSCTDKIEMTWKQNSLDGIQALWCARGSDTRENTLSAFKIDNNSIRFDRNDDVGAGTGEIAANVKYTAVADGSTLVARVMETDTGKVVADATMKSGIFIPGSQICLFASHVSTDADSNIDLYSSNTVYSFKITDSTGIAKCNLVPVKRIADGVVGLYDTVRSAFCTNGLSTGTLVAGLEVPTYVWIGGASGSMSDSANWDPSPSAAFNADVKLVVTNAAAIAIDAATTVGYIETAAADSVTFDGENVLTMTGALNHGPGTTTFSCPVDFSGTYYAEQTASIVFSGGATATYPAPVLRNTCSSDAMRTLCGTFNFTSDWIVPNLGDYPWIVPSNSVVHGQLLTGLQTNNRRILQIKEGGSAYFTTVTNGWERGGLDIDGYMEVSGDMIVRTSPTSSSSVSNFGRSGNKGTVKANRFAKCEHSPVKSLIPNLIVGSGGIGLFEQDYYWSFEVDTTVTVEEDCRLFGVYNSSEPYGWGLKVISGYTLTINVPEYKTVTFCGPVCGSGAISKTGAGTLLMTNTDGTTTGFTKQYEGGTTVEESILSVAAPTSIGTGTVTVHADATLQVQVADALASNALSVASGAIVDVSGLTDAMSIGSTISRTDSTADATLKFEIGSRAVSVGDCVASWPYSAGADSSISYSLCVDGVEPEDYALYLKAVDEETYGVYVKDARTPTFVKYVNGTWKYYIDSETEYTGEWTEGVTSGMQVWFSSGTDFAAICATNFSPAAFVMATNYFVNTACVTNDLTRLGSFVFAEGTVLDANGGCLKVSSDMAGGTMAFAVTNSNEEVGALEVSVANDAAITNTAMTLAGNLKFIKTGEGTFVPNKYNQMYTGGSVIAEGTVKLYNEKQDTLTYAMTPGSSTCGPYPLGTYDNKILVEEGAVLDVNGVYGFYHNGAILNGGTLKNSMNQAQTGWGSLGNIVLTADSYFSSEGTSVVTDPIDLGGHTLTCDITLTKYIYSRCSTITNGTIDIISGGWLHIFDASCDAKTVDLKVFCALNIAKSLSVHDYESTYNYNATKGTAALNVYGTFTPKTDYFYGCTMQDGSTIDLSSKTGTWSTTSSFTASSKTVTFADNATIKIKLGERSVPAGTKVVSWTTAPSNLDGLTFVRGDEDRQYFFSKESDGLYIHSPLILIVR